MAQATVTATAKIDVSPYGVSITFEGIDSDLAELMASGQSYICTKPVYRSYDTSDIIVKTRKALQFVEPVDIETVKTIKPTEIEDIIVPGVPPRVV